MSKTYHAITAAIWNEHHPVGTAVKYYPIAGDPQFAISTTRSEAWELGHGEPVVKLEGESGAICLSQILVIPGTVELRPCVFEFAKAMELKLRTHDVARGESWVHDETRPLLRRLEQELIELRDALHEDDHEGVLEESIDVSNFAMMIFDNGQRRLRGAKEESEQS